ncbi:MAG: ATP-binding protein [Polyangiales bacterium]
MSGTHEEGELQRRVRELEAQLADARDALSAARSAEAAWRSMVESAPDIIATIDPFNDYALRFMSQGPPNRNWEDVEGLNGLEFLTPASAEVAKAAYERILRTGEPQAYEARTRSPPAAESRWYAVRAGPLRDARGDITGIITVANDITEEKRREELLRLVTEQVPVIVWSTDASLRVTSSTGAGLRDTGAHSDELIGRTIEEIMAGQNDVIARYRDVLDGESVDLQTEWSGRVFEAWVEPMRDAEGRVAGTIGLALDVTDRRSLEEQLRQAQKMDAIGQLAGGIAHDFNNLLTAILGHEGVVSRRADDPAAVREGLHEIRRAAERASGLTRQLLAFSRRQVLQPTVIEPSEVVHDMERMLRRLLGEHIDVVVDVQDTGTVRADAGQLEQVIVNLAVNARDAMPEGGRLVIGVDTAHIGEGELAPLAAGDYVVLSVRDTGVGIDDRTCARIFEPFFTTKEEGTGLGLAMVYGIVGQSGGHVDVRSRPGQGTRFSVYLPRAGGAPPTPPIEPPPARDGEAETILLVEDEPIVRSLARRVLTEAGYVVLEAADGQEALEKVAYNEERIDLVVTDVVMPRLSGPQLVARLEETQPQARVLFVSGYPDPAKGRGDEPGSHLPEPLLAKPFKPDELVRRVRDLLDADPG